MFWYQHRNINDCFFSTLEYNYKVSGETMIQMVFDFFAMPGKLCSGSSVGYNIHIFFIWRNCDLWKTYLYWCNVMYHTCAQSTMQSTSMKAGKNHGMKKLLKWSVILVTKNVTAWYIICTLTVLMNSVISMVDSHHTVVCSLVIWHKSYYTSTTILIKYLQ